MPTFLSIQHPPDSWAWIARRHLPYSSSGGALDLTLRLASRQFNMFYYLPGSADHSGSGTTNVDESVSLALLPR
jgi:hypothetical protein